MSRTYRNRANPFFIREFNQYMCTSEECYVKELTWLWRYYTDRHDVFGMKKVFRKTVQKTRRAIDRMELHKCVIDTEYVPNMSSWNCKDSQVYNYL